jgi:hypothetical protein
MFHWNSMTEHIYSDAQFLPLSYNVELEHSPSGKGLDQRFYAGNNTVPEAWLVLMARDK